MMRTGVSTASLFMRENNEEALPLLDALGVRTAEVFLTSFSEYDRKFGELLAEKRGRVRVHSVHVLNTQFEPQLFSGNPRVKKDAFFWLERAMRAGQALGAKYYTFHGIARIKRASRSGEKDNFAAWGGGLREISEFCASFGIGLCLENVEWAMYNRPGFLRAAREFCPALSCVLDIKQARISSYPYTMYLQEMEGAPCARARFGRRRGRKNSTARQGDFRFSRIFKTARRRGIRRPPHHRGVQGRFFKSGGA